MFDRLLRSRYTYILGLLILVGCLTVVYYVTRPEKRISEPQVSHRVAPVAPSEDADTEPNEVENSSSAAAVSAATFDREVLQSKEPVLVDFWAPWCGPCKMMAPILDQLAQDYAGKVKVLKLNTDENQDIAKRYGVRGIPTLILFKNGEPVDRTVGVQTKVVIAAKLDEALEN